MTFYSPLRYPGGKGRLSNYFRLLLEENNQYQIPFVEPYAGGAGVALFLLFNDIVSEIYINDMNKSIYSFWYSVVNYPEELCNLIEFTDVSIDEWRKQKKIQDNFDSVSILEMGFSTLYLNRTNRSGIIKGGVIGGIEQKGEYKINARFNKSKLISRINSIAKLRTRINVSCFDAIDLISNVNSYLPNNAFLYLDPPYVKKGRGLYQNYYEYYNHLQISKLMKNIEKRWIISYDFTDSILNLYKEYNNIIYDLSYSVQKRYRGTEIMFFSNNLKVPDVMDPFSVTPLDFKEYEIKKEE